ncbi:MAG TPA: pyrroline-5-carboxylate reductase [Acidobacteriota bacterium]|nr:pyrroline-5-carboxylate reductase [Acidobacteriota bacterium]
MLCNKNIGFIGAGKMGEALIRGLLQSGRVKNSDIAVSDIDEERLAFLAEAYGIMTARSNTELAGAASIIIIAVKPHILDGVLDELAGAGVENRMLISVVAGATTERLAEKMPPGTRILRAMPNAPAAVLAGVTALYAGRTVTGDDLRQAVSIFECVGKTVVIQNESLMDAVTGLSGSGPAFVFLVMESLSDAGVHLGIPRKESALLAAQTVFGAARMALETGRSPVELKDVVSTPGGTTVAGLKMLEKGRLRSTIMDAVEAAASRSRELGGRPQK